MNNRIPGFLIAALFVAAPAAASAGDLVRTDGALEEGDALSADGSYKDVHTITVDAGTQIDVELDSTEFDTYVAIENAEGHVLAANDDGRTPGVGNNSRLTYRFTEAGTYRIVATSMFHGDSGAYQLVVTTPDASTAAE